jgi:DNA-binding NtrC family response regulator
VAETTQTTPREQIAGLTAYRLLLLYGPSEVADAVCVLSDEPLRLGRSISPGAPGLALNHAEVSREHALLEPVPGGGFVVSDLGSHNGTFVNRERISRRALTHGDVVRIGSCLLLFQALDSDACRRLLTSARWPAHGLLGSGPGILAVREAVEHAARTPEPVLITGESGVGKERVAAAIHARSGRSGAFVAVNCAALPAALAESELFGHVRGAFTGAANPSAGLFREADQGTLLLDEIGDMPLDLQAKLLRALAIGEVRAVGASKPHHVDVKLIAATNVALEAAVDAGRFRGDVYSRLLGTTIAVPMLRERREDILELARHFLERAQIGRELDPDAAEALLVHDWPFNVRELEQTVSQAGRSGTGSGIRFTDLPPRLRIPATTPPSRPPLPTTLSQPVPGLTPSKPELEAALEHFQGNVKRVAAFFKKERRDVYRWSERYGIDLERYR